MRLLLLVLLLPLAFSPLRGASKVIPPMEFEPLTVVPWNDPWVPMEQVLERIYREPNGRIRYAVLEKYFEVMLIEQLGPAFDRCLTLESTQRPNDLVALLLRPWAERDPQGCWQRTEQLFRIVGLEYGWLSYDGWNSREPIKVQDLEAIRASSIYLASHSLATFPFGINRSAAPETERVKILKAFTQKYLDAFGEWPVARNDKDYYNRFDVSLLDPFRWELDQLRLVDSKDVNLTEAGFEVCLRRWMQLETSAAEKILKKAEDAKWPNGPPAKGFRQPGISNELLMVWAKADLAAMIRKADSEKITDEDLKWQLRSFLMSGVDGEVQKRWLKEANGLDRNFQLIGGWAEWDLTNALEAAMALGDKELIDQIGSSSYCGPFPGQHNSSLFGLNAIEQFDVTRIRREIQRDATSNWYQILEEWGQVDAGAAARYGVKYLWQVKYAPREKLLSFFGGRTDEYADEGGMIDRTFCALRVWAVLQPAEMKEWIATLKDAELAKALTWLLENPWGPGRIK